MELKEIEEYVKKELSEERFFHSQGVMKKSIELAKRFGADIDIAAKIGMAHDVAKEIPEEEKIKYCEENNIKVDEIASKRKTMVSTGDRSAKIRTYNYPQNRVTDHRINYTMYNLANFMNGDIEEVLQALQVAENAERLKEAVE